MVCAGDKRGNLGFWDVQTYADAYESQQDSLDVDRALALPAKLANGLPGLHTHRPHVGAIPCMAFVGPSGGGSTNATRLLTCSYDGTMRVMDVAKSQFTECFQLPDLDDLIHYVDAATMDKTVTSMHPDTCLLATSSGYVGRCDLRMGGDKGATWYALHQAKIGTVSQHPTQSHLFATASNDRTAW